MRTFVVFGANGFIGSNLVDRLAKNNRVIAVDRFSHPPIFFKNKNITVKKADINKDLKKLSYLVREETVDGVIWAIGDIVPSQTLVNQDKILETSIPGIVILRDFIKKNIPIVLTSSAGMLYDPRNKITEKSRIDPWTWYGLQKLILEKALLLLAKDYKNTHLKIIRISSVFGERQPLDREQGVIGKVLKSSIKNEPFNLFGSSKARRDFIYIQDLVEIIERVILKNTKHTIYNVSSGTGYSLEEVVSFIEGISRKKLKIKRLEKREYDPQNIDVSNSRLLKEIKGFVFTPLEEGLTKTYTYFKDKL